MSAPRRLTGLVAALALGACATTSGGGGGDPFSGASSRGGGGRDGLRVEVRNDNFNEATIEAVMTGFRRRLGRVDGNGQASFTVPLTASNELQLRVELFGGNECLTRAVHVTAGETVRLQIDQQARPRDGGYLSLCEIQGRR